MTKLFTDLYPDQYIDDSGNTRLDGSNVSINNSLDVTDTSITTKQPVTVEATQFNEGNFYWKNKLADNLTDLPDGYVTLGFNRGIPYFASADFPRIAKYIDARGLVIADQDTTLDLNDEVVLIGGTEEDPTILTLPSNPYFNTKISYLGSIGNTVGQFDAGNTDIVLYGTDEDGIYNELFRGKTLTLNSPEDLHLRYVIVSSDPLVTQWSGEV